MGEASGGPWRPSSTSLAYREDEYPEASRSKVPRARLPEDHGAPPLLARSTMRTRLPESPSTRVPESKASWVEASKVCGAHLSNQFLLWSPQPAHGLLPGHWASPLPQLLLPPP